MARSRSVGISGSAVLLATAGLYLAYVGVKDVPFFEGLRDILRARQPQSKETHIAYKPQDVTGGTTLGTTVGAAIGRANDTGVDRLVGNAANGYQKLKAKFPQLEMLGWGLRPSGTSDHPRGLAIDVMTRDNAVAQQIIGQFRALPGAKYWIWNREIASVRTNWQIQRYTGLSPHTDHVHLSFT